MGRVVRLTESDLSRIVKRVIMEQKTHSGLAHAAEKLSSYGFKLNKTLSIVAKGNDMNGATIAYDHQNNKYRLSVRINGKSKIDKSYPVNPKTGVDIGKIIDDLGMYKTYKFK
jgi:hypothetical protein